MSVCVFGERIGLPDIETGGLYSEDSGSVEPAVLCLLGNGTFEFLVVVGKSL